MLFVVVTKQNDLLYVVLVHYFRICMNKINFVRLINIFPTYCYLQGGTFSGAWGLTSLQDPCFVSRLGCINIILSDFSLCVVFK